VRVQGLNGKDEEYKIDSGGDSGGRKGKTSRETLIRPITLYLILYLFFWLCHSLHYSIKMNHSFNPRNTFYRTYRLRLKVSISYDLYSQAF
jgi:hypothetical protein